VPEALLEHEESAADLVERRRPFLPDVAGAPCRHDLAREQIGEFRLLGRGEVGAIASGERGRDAVVLLDERAPRDFRRVCREHELDPKAADRLVQALGRHACRDQACEGFLARPALRRRRGIALIRTAPPDPVMLFGDVRKTQEVCERTCHWQRQFDGEPRQGRCKRPEVPVAASAAALRERPHLFDDVVEVVPFAGAEDVAEQLAEKSHIVSQRPVWIGRHHPL
jgi:hypothetical protein